MSGLSIVLKVMEVVLMLGFMVIGGMIVFNVMLKFSVNVGSGEWVEFI